MLRYHLTCGLRYNNILGFSRVSDLANWRLQSFSISFQLPAGQCIHFLCVQVRIALDYTFVGTRAVVKRPRPWAVSCGLHAALLFVSQPSSGTFPGSVGLISQPLRNAVHKVLVKQLFCAIPIWQFSFWKLHFVWCCETFMASILLLIIIIILTKDLEYAPG